MNLVTRTLAAAFLAATTFACTAETAPSPEPEPTVKHEQGSTGVRPVSREDGAPPGCNRYATTECVMQCWGDSNWEPGMQRECAHLCCQ